jgi:putative transcriptional regulator
MSDASFCKVAVPWYVHPYFAAVLSGGGAVLSSLILKRMEPTGAVRVAVGLMAVPPSAFLVWTFIHWIRGLDELQHRIVFQADRDGGAGEGRRAPRRGVGERVGGDGLPLRGRLSLGAAALPVKNRLRVLRAERGWSQADLAGRLGVSRQTVNAIETEKYDPSLPLAFKIARQFSMPIESIFQDGEGRRR